MLHKRIFILSWVFTWLFVSGVHEAFADGDFTNWTIPKPRACEGNSFSLDAVLAIPGEGVVPIVKCWDYKGNQVRVIIHRNGWQESITIKDPYNER